MFNKVILIGRLGQNAEAKAASNNRKFAVLNVATQESWKNDKDEYETRTEWHRVYAWGKLSRFAGKLEKGQLITLEGILRYREAETEQHGKQCFEQFIRQTADFTSISILGKDEQFTFFRRLVNFDEWRIAGKPQSSQYLDYQIVNSDIEAGRDHLSIGNHFVRTLTMKEAIAETRPLVLDQLLKIEANFYVVTEWTPLSMGKARREVEKRRKHFNMAKSGFLSQMRDPTATSARDVLIDESKQADVENLGDCRRALGEGQAMPSTTASPGLSK